MDLVQVNTKYSPNEVEQIDKAISKGVAINRSDFIRSAVRDRLKQIGESNVNCK